MWDVIEQREIRNFGGHTSSVTSVVLLSDADSKAVGTYNYRTEGGQELWWPYWVCDVRSASV